MKNYLKRILAIFIIAVMVLSDASVTAVADEIVAANQLVDEDNTATSFEERESEFETKTSTAEDASEVKSLDDSVNKEDSDVIESGEIEESVEKNTDEVSDGVGAESEVKESDDEDSIESAAESEDDLVESEEAEDKDNTDGLANDGSLKEKDSSSNAMSADEIDEEDETDEIADDNSDNFFEEFSAEYLQEAVHYQNAMGADDVKYRPTGVHFSWKQAVDPAVCSFAVYALNEENKFEAVIDNIAGQIKIDDYFTYTKSGDSWNVDLYWEARGGKTYNSTKYDGYKVTVTRNNVSSDSQVKVMDEGTNFWYGDVSKAKTGYKEVFFVDDELNELKTLNLHVGESKRVNLAIKIDGTYKILRGMRYNTKAGNISVTYYMDSLARGGFGNQEAFDVSWDVVDAGGKTSHVDGLFTEESLAGLSQYCVGTGVTKSGRVLIKVTIHNKHDRSSGAATLFGTQNLYLPVIVEPAEEGATYDAPEEINTNNYSDDPNGTYSTDKQEVYEIIRNRLTKRQVGFVLTSSSNNFSIDSDLIFDTYRERSGMTPKEGDYLHYCMGDKDNSISNYGDEYVLLHQPDWADEGVRWYLDGDYNALILDGVNTMITTAAQEQQVDDKIEQLLGEGGALHGVVGADKTDEQKIRAVYDYITSIQNGSMSDRTKPIYHTAYNLLINHTGTCEAYALLFERLVRELGVPSRIIMGVDASNHTYNIVRNGSYWYYIDTSANIYLKDAKSFSRASEQSQFKDQRFINSYLSKLKNSTYTYKGAATFSVDVYEGDDLLKSKEMDSEGSEGLEEAFSFIRKDDKEDTESSSDEIAHNRRYVINTNGNLVLSEIYQSGEFAFYNQDPSNTNPEDEYLIGNRVEWNLNGYTVNFYNGAYISSMQVGKIKGGTILFGNGTEVTLEAQSTTYEVGELVLDEVTIGYKAQGRNWGTTDRTINFHGAVTINDNCSISGIQTLKFWGNNSNGMFINCNISADNISASQSVSFNKNVSAKNFDYQGTGDVSEDGKRDRLIVNSLAVSGKCTLQNDVEMYVSDSFSANGGLRFNNFTYDYDVEVDGVFTHIYLLKKPDGTLARFNLKGALDTRYRKSESDESAGGGIKRDSEGNIKYIWGVRPLLFAAYELNEELGVVKKKLPINATVGTFTTVKGVPTSGVSSESTVSVAINTSNINDYCRIADGYRATSAESFELNGTSFQTVDRMKGEVSSSTASYKLSYSYDEDGDGEIDEFDRYFANYAGVVSAINSIENSIIEKAAESEASADSLDYTITVLKSTNEVLDTLPTRAKSLSFIVNNDKDNYVYLAHKESDYENIPITFDSVIKDRMYYVTFTCFEGDDLYKYGDVTVNGKCICTVLGRSTFNEISIGTEARLAVHNKVTANELNLGEGSQLWFNTTKSKDGTLNYGQLVVDSLNKAGDKLYIKDYIDPVTRNKEDAVNNILIKTKFTYSPDDISYIQNDPLAYSISVSEKDSEGYSSISVGAKPSYKVIEVIDEVEQDEKDFYYWETTNGSEGVLDYFKSLGTTAKDKEYIIEFQKGANKITNGVLPTNVGVIALTASDTKIAEDGGQYGLVSVYTANGLITAGSDLLIKGLSIRAYKSGVPASEQSLGMIKSQGYELGLEDSQVSSVTGAQKTGVLTSVGHTEIRGAVTGYNEVIIYACFDGGEETQQGSLTVSEKFSGVNKLILNNAELVLTGGKANTVTDIEVANVNGTISFNNFGSNSLTIAGTISGNPLKVYKNHSDKTEPFAQAEKIATAAKCSPEQFVIPPASETVNNVAYKSGKDIYCGKEAIYVYSKASEEAAEQLIGKYALWADAINAINARNDGTSIYNLCILDDYNIGGGFLMPKKGLFSKLNIISTKMVEEQPATVKLSYTSDLSLSGDVDICNVTMEKLDKKGNVAAQNAVLNVYSLNLLGDTVVSRLTNVTGNAASSVLHSYNDLEVLGKITNLKELSLEKKGTFAGDVKGVGTLTLKDALDFKGGFSVGNIVTSAPSDGSLYPRLNYKLSKQQIISGVINGTVALGIYKDSGELYSEEDFTDRLIIIDNAPQIDIMRLGFAVKTDSGEVLVMNLNNMKPYHAGSAIKLTAQMMVTVMTDKCDVGDEPEGAEFALIEDAIKYIEQLPSVGSGDFNAYLYVKDGLTVSGDLKVSGNRVIYHVRNYNTADGADPAVIKVKGNVIVDGYSKLYIKDDTSIQNLKGGKANFVVKTGSQANFINVDLNQLDVDATSSAMIEVHGDNVVTVGGAVNGAGYLGISPVKANGEDYDADEYASTSSENVIFANNVNIGSLDLGESKEPNILFKGNLTVNDIGLVYCHGETKPVVEKQSLAKINIATGKKFTVNGSITLIDGNSREENDLGGGVITVNRVDLDKKTGAATLSAKLANKTEMIVATNAEVSGRLFATENTVPGSTSIYLLAKEGKIIKTGAVVAYAYKNVEADCNESNNYERNNDRDEGTVRAFASFNEALSYVKSIENDNAEDNVWIISLVANASGVSFADMPKNLGFVVKDKEFGSNKNAAVAVTGTAKVNSNLNFINVDLTGNKTVFDSNKKTLTFIKSTAKLGTVRNLAELNVNESYIELGSGSTVNDIKINDAGSTVKCPMVMGFEE